MNEFEWDEAKRQSNLAKHDFDFIDGTVRFDGRPTLSVSSQRGDEARTVTVGILDDEFATVVWTLRAGKIRLISMRRTRVAEKRKYRQRHGG